MTGIYFTASRDKPDALEAMAALAARYGACPLEKADVVVALGGDGFVLHTLKNLKRRPLPPVFGLNFGRVGFLMNPYAPEGLDARIRQAEKVCFYPLVAKGGTQGGSSFFHQAFNDISVTRAGHQACLLQISVHFQQTLEQHEFLGDGLIVASQMGSTGYACAAGAEPLKPGAPFLRLQTVAPADMLKNEVPDEALISIRGLELAKRPINLVADTISVENIKSCSIMRETSPALAAHLLFDKELPYTLRITRARAAFFKRNIARWTERMKQWENERA